MSRYARRKQKIVYEDDPVVAPPKPPVQDEPDEVVTHVTRGGVRPEPTPETKVGPTSAKHQGITELMERAAAIASHNPKPQVIGIKSVVLDDPQTVASNKPTANRVDVEERVTSPIDESVPGYGNVIGGKEKRVKHT